MIIILEGPDGSGKTSLGEQIAPILNRQLIHSGGKPESVEKFHQRFFFAINNSEKYIFDRFNHISELVYGLLLRGRSIIPSNRIYGQLQLLATLPTLIIYARPDKPTLFKRMQELNKKKHKEESLISAVASQSMAIIERYDLVMEDLSSILTIETYNHLEVDAITFLKYLKERYQLEERVLNVWNRFSY